ncbi:hypothetical protein EVAR_55915_1 [Eumeta japonica]|uniref:Uncharacterized protein n=1 Tax=Eumeta variegata TaxID=151549 RepID=A0A4C1SGW4_EUMVA|nr:hypothetical protein EVAR_55915_1 [Eumeta japonica]
MESNLRGVRQWIPSFLPFSKSKRSYEPSASRFVTAAHEDLQLESGHQYVVSLSYKSSDGGQSELIEEGDLYGSGASGGLGRGAVHTAYVPTERFTAASIETKTTCAPPTFNLHMPNYELCLSVKSVPAINLEYYLCPLINSFLS